MDRKKLLPLIALILMGIVSTADTKPPRALQSDVARAQAQKAIHDFARHRDNLSTVRLKRCRKISRFRFTCKGVASGADRRNRYKCKLTASVRRTRGSGRGHLRARLTRRSCDRTAKPYLTRDDALAAFEERVEREAPSSLREIDYVKRLSNTKFRALALWSDVLSHGDTRNCSMPMLAELTGRKVVVTGDASC